MVDVAAYVWHDVFFIIDHACIGCWLNERPSEQDALSLLSFFAHSASQPCIASHWHAGHACISYISLMLRGAHCLPAGGSVTYIYS